VRRVRIRDEEKVPRNILSTTVKRLMDDTNLGMKRRKKRRKKKKKH